jgi:anti-sigma factor ChrR (cupin superfamily)
MLKASAITAPLITAIAFSSNIFANDLQIDVPKDTLRFWSDKIEWRNAGPNLPKGTQIAVLEGSPKKEGMFTLRLKTPKNMKLAVHQHPGPERVTILEGEMFVGFGDKFNDQVGTKFTAGSFYVNPGNENHYVYTKEEPAIIQITGMGPWQVIYAK